MDGNGERISIWRGLASIVRAPIEERYLRETWARGERLQAEAANRILEQVVRQVEPETDGYIPLTGLYGERQLNQQETQDLRDQAMKGWLKQPHARGYIDSLKRFTMGKGPQFVPKVEDDKLKGRLTDWWKQFARLNNWDNLEDEIPVRTWRDGETFVRRFIHAGGMRDLELSDSVQHYLTRHGFDASTALVEEVPAGMVFLRLIPPEQIVDPEDVISYGILTSGADVQTVLGYVWSVEGQVKEIIPAADILHTKTGVDSDVKRGRSVLEIILPYEKKYSDWLEYRIALNLARTAVVLFRKVQGTPTQVSQVRNAQETQRETGTNDRRVRMLKPMTTFTHNQGVEYEFKSPNIQASDAQHDGRHILLTMAAAAGLPEYMFTGDASNANYASTMVSESPAVREFESWQDFFTPVFKQIWHWVVEAAAEHEGIEALSPEKAKELDVEIAWPPMMSRDELQHTQANKARHEGGILSREGWASDDGIDWEVERKRLANELKEALASPPEQVLERLAKVVSSGVLTPDPGLEAFIRTMIGAPALRGEEPSDGDGD